MNEVVGAAANGSRPLPRFLAWHPLRERVILAFMAESGPGENEQANGSQGGSHEERTLSLGASIRVPYPDPTSAGISAAMKGNRSLDTQPEIRLRSALHRRGWRFRKNVRIDAGSRRPRADIVFGRQRVAVFVDGCFWHGCPQHGRRPSSNSEYWNAKLQRNMERDRDTDVALAGAGWRVIRVWEHESIEDATAKVEAALQSPACRADASN